MIFCRFYKINNFDYDCGAKRYAMKTQGHGGVGRSNRTPSISMFLCICSRRIVQKFLLEVHTHFCRYRDVVGDVGYGEDLNPKSFNLSPSPIKEFLVFVLEEILEYVNCFSFLCYYEEKNLSMELREKGFTEVNLVLRIIDSRNGQMKSCGFRF